MTRIGPTRFKVLLCVLEGADRGVPPTYREIGERVGIAVHGVDQHLNALAREGLIRRDGSARALVPLCRFIPADQLGSQP